LLGWFKATGSRLNEDRRFLRGNTAGESSISGIDPLSRRLFLVGVAGRPSWRLSLTSFVRVPDRFSSSPPRAGVPGRTSASTTFLARDLGVVSAVSETKLTFFSDSIVVVLSAGVETLARPRPLVGVTVAGELAELLDVRGLRTCVRAPLTFSKTGLTATSGVAVLVRVARGVKSSTAAIVISLTRRLRRDVPGVSAGVPVPVFLTRAEGVAAFLAGVDFPVTAALTGVDFPVTAILTSSATNCGSSAGSDHFVNIYLPLL